MRYFGGCAWRARFDFHAVVVAEVVNQTTRTVETVRALLLEENSPFHWVLLPLNLPIADAPSLSARSTQRATATVDITQRAKVVFLGDAGVGEKNASKASNVS